MGYFQKLLRTLSSYLPKAIRFRMLRRLISVDYDLPEELSFRLATTQEDLEAAYAILHDSYVGMNYMQPDPSGLRVTKYFALPTTSTLIACLGSKVIGTMSIVRSSPLGLPMDHAMDSVVNQAVDQRYLDVLDINQLLGFTTVQTFNLNHLREQGLRIAEVSSLAIAPEYRLSRGQVFLPLCKFFYDYARFYMSLDAVVIAVNPSWADFYEGLLMFELLKAPVIKNYGFANGAPAVGMILHLGKSETDFEKCYSHLSKKNNLFNFFVKSKARQSHFPSREYEKSLDPVMTPAMLDYFFRQRSPIFAELSDFEIRHLTAAYPHPQYQFVLPKFKIDGQNSISREARFVVNIHAKTVDESPKSIFIIEVSHEGLRLKGKFVENQTFYLQVLLGPENISRLVLRIIWQDQVAPFAGAVILQSDPSWDQYLLYLSKDLLKVSA